MTNGIVSAAAIHEQTLYIGGTFTRVAPTANLLGPWFGVSTTTGMAIPRLPLADGPIQVIEPDGAGGFYVGGAFARIGDFERTGLAHVLADGTVDPVFVPDLAPAFTVYGTTNPVPEVRSLAKFGAKLFVGGGISSGLLALDATTAARLTWAPSLSAGLQGQKILLHGGRVIIAGQPYLPGPQGTIVFAADPETGAVTWTRELGGSTLSDAVITGGRLIVVGSFVYGQNICAAVSLDADTGVVDTNWAPSSTCPPGREPTIYAVAVVGGTVYVGGSFTELGGQPRSNLAAIDLASGTLTSWAPLVDGPVRDIVPASGESIYVAGSFRHIAGIAREALAEINSTGSATAWSPDAHSTDVRTLHLTGGTVLAGGTPAVSGGVARDRLAAFALDTNEVRQWAPSVEFEVVDMAADAGHVFVSFNRLDASGPNPEPKVLALDGVTGARAWSFPDFTIALSGATAGDVYVQRFVGTWTELSRADVRTGAMDSSWRFAAAPVQLLPAGDRIYLIGASLPFYRSSALAAVDRRTGEISPWDPYAIFPPAPPESFPVVRRAAVMGRTMYVQYLWSGVGTQSNAITAVDVDSGLAVTPIVSSVNILDMAAVDGVVIAVGRATPLVFPRETWSVRALRPDGSVSDWNPHLTLTESETPFGLYGSQPRVLVSESDVVVTGVQRVDGSVPVQGVAVFSRERSAAPSELAATVIDQTVRLTWTAAASSVASHIVEVGSARGESNVIVVETGSSRPALDAVGPDGTYFVRVKAAGAAPATDAAVPTNEIAVRVGCDAPPPSPTAFTATLNGLNVRLTWDASPFSSVGRYVLEAGTGPGLANLARLVLHGQQTSYATDAPPGTYFVRVRAENTCGTSAPSTDLRLTVGEGALPAAPTNLSVSGNVPTYSLYWAAVPGATAYIVEAGSSPGATDVARTMTEGTSLGPATVVYFQTYYLRVRAVNDAGVGPPSKEYVLLAR